MRNSINTLGNDFSTWADLTAEYAEGLEALRRREPGASVRMMALAKLMKQHAIRIDPNGIPPICTTKAQEQAEEVTDSWFGRAIRMIPAGRGRSLQSAASFFS